MKKKLIINKYMVILLLLINIVGCGAGINKEKKKEVENYITSNLPNEVKSVFENDEAETGIKYKEKNLIIHTLYYIQVQQLKGLK